MSDIKSDIKVDVQLFGALRKYGTNIEVTIPSGASVAALKNTLAALLGDTALVMDCVIANDETILPEAYIIEGSAPLSILPPVCGG